MNVTPLHKLCYSTDVSVEQINEKLNNYHHYGDDNNGNTHQIAAQHLDPFHRMTPLHMLAMNPHAPEDAIAGNLLLANTMDIKSIQDDKGNTSRLCKGIQCTWCMNYTHSKGTKCKVSDASIAYKEPSIQK